MAYAPVIYGMMKVLTPVIFVVNKVANGFLRLLRVDLNRKTHAITEDELRTLVDAGHEEGVIESEERRMINNVFDFGDSMAKDIMVPRIDMSCVDIDATYEELMKTFRQDIDVYKRQSEDKLQTWEGIAELAEMYYKWTDAQTPEPEDGKAFFGRDEMANYILIGSKQMGHEVFQVKDGQVTYNLDLSLIHI